MFCFIYQKLDFKHHSFLFALWIEKYQIIIYTTILQAGNSLFLFSSDTICWYTGCFMGNTRFWNGCYRAGREGRGLGRGQLNSSGHSISVAIMPQWTLEHRAFAYDSRKKWWNDYWNSAALSLPFQYRASWEHSKSQYHLEVGHIFSNKRNNNKEETTWACPNCMNLGECGKSERGHCEESNPFCSATCCWIRNERKNSKANLT